MNKENQGEYFRSKLLRIVDLTSIFAYYECLFYYSVKNVSIFFFVKTDLEHSFSNEKTLTKVKDP